jgi:hypothetical protein
VDVEFLFIPLRWVAKSASFAGYFLPLRSDGVLFVMKGSGIWDRDHGAREPAEALRREAAPRAAIRPLPPQFLHLIG